MFYKLKASNQEKYNANIDGYKKNPPNKRDISKQKAKYMGFIYFFPIRRTKINACEIRKKVNMWAKNQQN